MITLEKKSEWEDTFVEGIGQWTVHHGGMCVSLHSMFPLPLPFLPPFHLISMLCRSYETSPFSRRTGLKFVHPRVVVMAVGAIPNLGIHCLDVYKMSLIEQGSDVALC